MNNNSEEKSNKENEYEKIRFTGNRKKYESKIELIFYKFIYIFGAILLLLSLFAYIYNWYQIGIASFMLGLFIACIFIAKELGGDEPEDLIFSNNMLEIYLKQALYFSINWKDIKNVEINKECFRASLSHKFGTAHNLKFNFINDILEYRLWWIYFEPSEQEKIIKTLIKYLKKNEITYEFKIKEELIDYLTYSSLIEQHYIKRDRCKMENEQNFDILTYSQNKSLMIYPEIKQDTVIHVYEHIAKNNTEEIRFSSYNLKEKITSLIFFTIFSQIIIAPIFIVLIVISYLYNANFLIELILYLLILGIIITIGFIFIFISKHEAEELVFTKDKFEILFYKIPYQSLEWKCIKKVEIIEESFKTYKRTIFISHNLIFSCTNDNFEYRLWWNFFELSKQQKIVKTLIQFLKKNDIIFESIIKKETADISNSYPLKVKHNLIKKTFKKELKQQLQYSPYVSN